MRSNEAIYHRWLGWHRDRAQQPPHLRAHKAHSRARTRRRRRRGQRARMSKIRASATNLTRRSFQMRLGHVVALDLRGAASDAAGGPDYVLDVVAADDVIAVSSSSHEIKVYHAAPTGLVLRHALRGHAGAVNDLALDRTEPHLLWSCGGDGVVGAWDLRSGVPAATLVDPARPRDALLSFSRNADRTLIAGGCALTQGGGEAEARLKFWDVRTGGVLAQFCESHNDDITRVRFHPGAPNFLAACSEDGLVAFYALTPALDEDDSLESVLNTGQNVSRLGFFAPASELLYCTTNVETVEAWHPMQAKKLHDYGDLRAASAQLGQTADYAVDCCYNAATDELAVVGGTFDGHLALFHASGPALRPVGVLAGGHVDRIRCCMWDFAHQRMWTGGEDGRVCLWLEAANGSAVAPAASHKVCVRRALHHADRSSQLRARGTHADAGAAGGSAAGRRSKPYM
eukprot:Unigene9194_Nuclearia_a/m.28099 Unigene9194_Nuclearia_a/g.28099  ORF Unigene9194_Nuclearia_a/g.28099 Unigene9194_Nuclearia_a/m.28099 type:complete len:457 (+) Unigene9194_Nuclearia_a:438-1808(+)